MSMSTLKNIIKNFIKTASFYFGATNKTKFIQYTYANSSKLKHSDTLFKFR